MTTLRSPQIFFGFSVVEVSSDEQLQHAYDVRLEVFVAEQNVPVEEELDALDTDPTTTHVIAVDDATGETLGTARLLPAPNQPGHFHIGRVAVRKSARGRKIGVALLSVLEDVAQMQSSSSATVIELSAQTQATGFYSKIGYEQLSEKQYLDAGIWHVDMAKTFELPA